MRTRPIKFDDDKIPAWTYDGSEPSIHTFISAIALSGLEDTMIRLSSALQTRLLGHNVFGKQHFMLRNPCTTPARKPRTPSIKASTTEAASVYRSGKQSSNAGPKSVGDKRFRCVDQPARFEGKTMGSPIESWQAMAESAEITAARPVRVAR